MNNKYVLQPIKTFFKQLLLLMLFMNTNAGLAQTVVITDRADDTTGNTSAVLDLKSTTKGFLPPRMTEAQRLAISNPADGLLVYQNDHVEGIYYYKDSSWHALDLSAAALSVPVTKTTSDTLLKSETMVLASNNISLILPAITAADDGLSVTVKNIGTATDIVTISGNAGALIDSTAALPLPRWFAITVLAKNGNWYLKQRTLFPVNTLLVSWHSPWKTLDEALAFLNAHMWGPAVIELEAGTFTISETQLINLPYPLTIKGSSFGSTIIIPGAGLANKPMFTCETETYFKQLVFNGAALSGYGNNSGEDAIRFTSAGIYYEVKDCSFDHFNKTIVLEDAVELWLFENDISDAIESGVEVAAGSGSVFFKTSETDFLSCKKGINLTSSDNAQVSVINCGFYNTDSSEIGVNYTPATFTSIQNISITSNTWNHIGSFTNGFDFSRTDGRDKEIEVMSNLGYENQNPHCKINLLNNTTSMSVSNVWIKAVWSSAAQSQIPCKFLTGTNKLTYLPSSKRDLIMWISGNVIVSTSSSRVVNVAVVKNGNSSIRYGESSVRISTSGQPFQWSTVIYIPSVAPSDYFELWTNLGSASTETVIFQDINWFTNSQ